MHYLMGRWAASARVLALGSSVVLCAAGCGESEGNASNEETNDATGDANTSPNDATGGANTSSSDGTGGANTTSSDATGGANTTGTTATYEEGLALVDLPVAYGNAYCSWIFRCCPDEQIQHIADSGFSFYGTTEAECQTNLTALMLFVVPSITKGESEGRSQYDALAAAACMDTIETTCSDPESACSPFIVPLVAPGGVCGTDAECMGGLSCIGASAVNEPDPVEGTCAAPLGLGEECESDSDCASTACSDTCVEAGAPGETCFSDSTCASAYCDIEANSCAEAPYATSCTL